LHKYIRQYIGFYNSKNQKCIYIEFIFLSKADEDIKKELNKNIICGCGDWFENYTFSLELNLETEKLTWFGWAEKELN